MNEDYERIYAAVRTIPRGRVATYGQIARLAGMPRHARLAGRALSALSGAHDVPWHRVINARGEISLVDEHAELQRGLLEAEGVELTDAGRVSLRHYRWDVGA